MSSETKNIYLRVYDNPKKEDGTDKPNEFLGEFEVKKQLEEGCYSEKFIGVNKQDNKEYLVQGFEVSGFYHKGLGGMKYEITKIQD